MTTTDCPLDICSGDGWIEVADFTPNRRERCPCRYAAYDTYLPPEPDEAVRIGRHIQELGDKP